MECNMYVDLMGCFSLVVSFLVAFLPGWLLFVSLCVKRGPKGILQAQHHSTVVQALFLSILWVACELKLWRCFHGCKGK